MTSSILFKQRGVVLIFTMIMLLLLTLVAVSMIQSNKQELAMSANAIRQNAILALAEKLLVQAEEALEDSAAHQPSIDNNGINFYCTPTNPMGGGLPVQTPLLAGTRPDGFPEQAEILQVSCLLKDPTAVVGGVAKDTLKEVMCSSYEPDTGVISCYPNNDDNTLPEPCPGVDNTVSATTIPAVNYINNDGVNPVTPNSGHACYNILKPLATDAKCTTEVYTIRVTASDESGAQRTIESRYNIGCGAF